MSLINLFPVYLQMNAWIDLNQYKSIKQVPKKLVQENRWNMGWGVLAVIWYKMGIQFCLRESYNHCVGWWGETCDTSCERTKSSRKLWCFWFILFMFKEIILSSPGPKPQTPKPKNPKGPWAYTKISRATHHPRCTARGRTWSSPPCSVRTSSVYLFYLFFVF